MEAPGLDEPVELIITGPKRLICTLKQALEKGVGNRNVEAPSGTVPHLISMPANLIEPTRDF